MNENTTDGPKKYAPFKPVKDGRGHPIRGLCQRNGKFYARLAYEGAVTRVPLVDEDQFPVSTPAKAKEAMELLKQQRKHGDLPAKGRTTFAACVDEYLKHIEGLKAPSTVSGEKYHLQGKRGGWVNVLGGLPLRKIRLKHIEDSIDQRRKADTGPGTIKLSVAILNNVFNYAKRHKWIKILPTEELESLPRKSAQAGKYVPLTHKDLESLCAAAVAKQPDGSPVAKNGEQFADYLRLLAYSGAREQEALRLRWQDVSLERERLTIGALGSKNGLSRTVDMTAELKAHLISMRKRRAPDTNWLFPSPLRGENDIPAKSLRETLHAVRKHAAKTRPSLADRAFHDLRKFFASQCVMSGLDFKTVAEWLGHQDGGMLVATTYGHLSQDHKRQQAQRVVFKTPKNVVHLHDDTDTQVEGIA